jgi:putative MATE family efflux protein
MDASPSTSASKVTTARVFAIAGPAMIANLTTPLIGIVSTTAIGRLGEPALLGGVALASVIFDCVFWLFAFVRMSTTAFAAQSLGAGETTELRAILVRGFIVAAIIGVALIVLQVPLVSLLLGAMGGSDAVTQAAKTYFHIRIWSAPLVLINYVVLGWLIGLAHARLALGLQIAINIINAGATVVLVLVLDFGIAGAAIASVSAEAVGVVLGVLAAGRLTQWKLEIEPGSLFERSKLVRMLAVNRDIMIRTAALIAVWLFFAAQGARTGDLALAANSVLNNFLLISSFFLDGLANAAQQLCGQAGDRVGLCLFVCRQRGIPAVRPLADRHHDHQRRGARHRARLPAICTVGAAARRIRLCLRRRLYWGYLGARHAKSDGRLACAFLCGLVRVAQLRQCRAVGRAAVPLRRARRVAGATLPVAAEGVVYFTGQSSAVIVAASAPTISDNESRPVRSKVEERSRLMLSTRPSPL